MKPYFFKLDIVRYAVDLTPEYEAIRPRVDTSISADLVLPGGVGVRIITRGDAEYWDNDMTREELPGIKKSVLPIWQDSVDLKDKKDIENLARESRQIATRVVVFSSLYNPVNLLIKID